MHHGELHANYVNNLNDLYRKANAAVKKDDTEAYIDLYEELKFNEGMHLNHEFFWESLAPTSNGGGEVLRFWNVFDKAFLNATAGTFGSMNDLIYKFNEKALAFEEKDGWVWLVLNTYTNKFEIR